MVIGHDRMNLWLTSKITYCWLLQHEPENLLLSCSSVALFVCKYWKGFVISFRWLAFLLCKIEGAFYHCYIQTSNFRSHSFEQCLRNKQGDLFYFILIAQAVTNESAANFIHIKVGPYLPSLFLYFPRQFCFWSRSKEYYIPPTKSIVEIMHLLSNVLGSWTSE